MQTPELALRSFLFSSVYLSEEDFFLRSVTKANTNAPMSSKWISALVISQRKRPNTQNIRNTTIMM